MSSRLLAAAVALAAVITAPPPALAQAFDHTYALYAEVLARHVRPPRVDYAALKADRARLDRAVAAFDAPAAHGESGWTREQRLAFWINAYNAFTLRAIVDHYPIKAGWFSRPPRNSIRQIDGVWTDLTFAAAGRQVTLDDIEHRILRPVFADARIHFAINCASVSCPPLAAQPYQPATLASQLDEAGRIYLASGEGLRRSGDTLLVSSIFKWYGEDFVAGYAPLGPDGRDAKERAILGVVVRYGPADAARLAGSGRARLRFLDYDWTLNDDAAAESAAALRPRAVGPAGRTSVWQSPPAARATLPARRQTWLLPR